MAPPENNPTAKAAISTATARLSAAGIDGPGRDARLLVAAASGSSQPELILRPDRRLSEPELRRLDDMVARRCRHEPVSRILGEREFYGRPFLITPATLDPRPDSETLIEAVLQTVKNERAHDRALRILDIGTGTGCLLATLLCELPAAVGVAVEVSAAALEVAKRNFERLDVADRAECRLQSAADICDTFDIVVSNPPYIPSSDISGLDVDVKDYDPTLALDGGIDGLDIYRQIALRLTIVVPAGWAFFEVGDGQAPDVERILRETLLQRIKRLGIRRDLGGRQRCVALEIQR